MITLTKNQINTIHMLFETIDKTENMIQEYSKTGLDELGSVVLEIKSNGTSGEVILNRKVFAEALIKQLSVYHGMLGTLGVSYKRD